MPQATRIALFLLALSGKNKRQLSWLNDFPKFCIGDNCSAVLGEDGKGSRFFLNRAIGIDKSHNSAEINK